jgi:hypothetical protein
MDLQAARTYHRVRGLLHAPKARLRPEHHQGRLLLERQLQAVLRIA